MPRIRSIKPGFFTNDALAEVHPLGRLLFSGLWCHADRAGRLEDRPRKLKAEVLPYDDCDIDALLGDLAARGFVVRYQAGGVRYLQVVNFDKHQTPNIREGDSTIPPPPSTVPEQYKHDTGANLDLHLTVLGTDLGTGTDLDQEQSWEGVQGEPNRAAEPRRAPPAASVAADAPQQQTTTRPVRPVPKAKDRPPPPEELPLWDALAAGIGVSPVTVAERGLYGGAVKQLRALGATGDDVLTRCANYRLTWPDMDLTVPALLKHWSRMQHPPPRDKIHGRGQHGPTARNVAALKEAF